MGTTHVTVRVANLTGQGPAYEADFLVDTGAIDCLAPAERLREIGVRPEGRRAYELANGQPVQYEYGFARVKFLGDETVTRIIFGPAEAEPILGVLALESTGVVVDPVSQTLKRLPAQPLK